MLRLRMMHSRESLLVERQREMEREREREKRREREREREREMGGERDGGRERRERERGTIKNHANYYHVRDSPGENIAIDVVTSPNQHSTGFVIKWFQSKKIASTGHQNTSAMRNAANDEINDIKEMR